MINHVVIDQHGRGKHPIWGRDTNFPDSDAHPMSAWTVSVVASFKPFLGREVAKLAFMKTASQEYDILIEAVRK